MDFEKLTTFLKTMNINLTPAETEKLVLALVNHYKDKRKKLQASKKRIQNRHNLEIYFKIQNEIRTQELHNAYLKILNGIIKVNEQIMHSAESVLTQKEVKKRTLLLKRNIEEIDLLIDSLKVLKKHLSILNK